MDTILFRTKLTEVIDDFLEKSSDYFTTPISVSTFLDGLQHKWTDPYEVLREMREEILPEEVEVEWTPVQASIGIDFYEIVWGLHRLDPGSQESGQPEEEEAQPEEEEEEQPEEEEAQPEEEQASYTTPATAESLLLEPIDLSSIPYIDSITEESDIPSVLRARDRRLIRETRLQAELLYLRSKRLAQRYLNKYTTMNIPDTESNLSFSSDGEDN